MLLFTSFDLPDECRKYFLDKDKNLALFIDKLYAKLDSTLTFSVDSVAAFKKFGNMVRLILQKRDAIFKEIVFDISKKESINFPPGFFYKYKKLHLMKHSTLRAEITARIVRLYLNNHPPIWISYNKLDTFKFNKRKNKALLQYCHQELYSLNILHKVSFTITACLAHITCDKLEKNFFYIDEYITKLCLEGVTKYCSSDSIPTEKYDDIGRFFAKCGDAASKAVKSYMLHKPNLKTAYLMNISVKKYESRTRGIDKIYTHPNLPLDNNKKEQSGFDQSGTRVPISESNQDYSDEFFEE